MGKLWVSLNENLWDVREHQAPSATSPVPHLLQPAPVLPAREGVLGLHRQLRLDGLGTDRMQGHQKLLFGFLKGGQRNHGVGPFRGKGKPKHHSLNRGEYPLASPQGRANSQYAQWFGGHHCVLSRSPYQIPMLVGRTLNNSHQKHRRHHQEYTHTMLLRGQESSSLCVRLHPCALSSHHTWWWVFSTCPSPEGSPETWADRTCELLSLSGRRLLPDLQV